MPKRRLILVDYPPPPTPGDVLYVEPTGTGEGRLCANCVLWDPTGRCSIHDARIRIGPRMVCGYHVYGSPSSPIFRDIMHVEPELSGLVTAGPSGSSCGNCIHMRVVAEDRTTRCAVVASDITHDGWEPAIVDPEGCCTRWSSG